MKKNISIIVQNLKHGGAERMAVNLANELCEYYNVYLIVFDASEAIYSTNANIIDLMIPPDKHAGKFEKVIKVIKRVNKLRKIKKEKNIVLSIGHMDGANIVNILSRRKDKVISVFHSMPSKDINNSIMNRLLQKFICKKSSQYVMVSEVAVSDMKNNFTGQDSKVCCIHNFVNVNKIQQMAAENIEDDDIIQFFSNHDEIIINVGRLSVEKAQDRLISVFQQMKKERNNIGLVILGNGVEEDNLRLLVKDYGLQEDVFMPGEVMNPFPYMKKSTVFVLCSYYEGLPMVLIEAAACGCPLISCDMKSGAREVLAPDTYVFNEASNVEYARYGLLVPMLNDKVSGDERIQDEKYMLAAIREMLVDVSTRQLYINRLQECISEYDVKAIIPKWVSLIESMTE